MTTTNSHDGTSATTSGGVARVTWWKREHVRQLLAMPPAAIGLLAPGEAIVRVIAFWDIFAVVYLALTWTAFGQCRPTDIDAMVRVNKRLLGVIAHPQQLSQSAALMALLATAFTMPRAGEPGVPTELVLALSIVAVVLCWIVLQAGFAMAYMSLYAQVGGIRFPGKGKPGLVEFAYFTLAIGTTFGTTDVTVTKRPIRRQVLAHGALAFFFNTLILALAVSLVTQFVGT